MTMITVDQTNSGRPIASGGFADAVGIGALRQRSLQDGELLNGWKE